MMRRIVLIILVAFVVSKAFSQTVDTVQNESIRKIYKYAAVKGNPIIVINGVIYTAKHKQLNTDDIESFVLLKPPGATNIYGTQAADGAILITTRNIKKNDTLSELHKQDFFKNLTYVLNGEPSTYKAVSVLNPGDILNITTLKYDKKSVSEEFRDKRTLAVITKSFAKESYQAVFSKFSKDYKNSLDSNKYDDSKFFYVLNGQPLEIEDKRIKTLFDIHEYEVKSVHFMGKFYKGVVNNQKEVVLIQTK